MHLRSRRDIASFTLGVVSVIVWVVAEIPQIITNYRAKSTDGLSITFLVTWMIGDLFNLFGCMLEPATLPTQLYMAVLYTIITVALGSQTIYYGHIYPQSKYKRQLKHEQVETPTKVGLAGKISVVEQSHEFDDFSRGTGLSSPIPLPAHPQSISTGRELFYQSARSLSKSLQTPTAGSILAQRISPFLDPIQENLLGSAAVTKSAPTLKIKSTLCVVSGDQLLENGALGTGGIGTFLGWAMTFVYLGGRLPQIFLNIRRGHVEGHNPLMFLFALIGNATYVASILVSSVDWSTIGPNLPWLVDAGGCVLFDFFILIQFYISAVGPHQACRVNINIRPFLIEEETRIFS